MRGRGSKAAKVGVAKMFVAMMGLALAGCVDTAGKLEVDPNASVEAVRVVAVPGADLSAAPLAIVRLEGLNGDMMSAFVADVQREATARQVVLSEEKKAKFQAVGYISAFGVGPATHFVYVWDVFDTGQHLRQRVSDAVVVPVATPDPMSLLSPEVSHALASKSADDLAAVLSTQPETRAKGR